MHPWTPYLDPDLREGYENAHQDKTHHLIMRYVPRATFENKKVYKANTQLQPIFLFKQSGFTVDIKVNSFQN